MRDTIDDRASRLEWRAARLMMEERMYRTATRTSFQGSKRLMPMALNTVLECFAWSTGLLRTMTENAQRFRVEDHVFHFPDLPAAFDGYRILHLSDLHVSGVQQSIREVPARIAPWEPDLVVITGDIQTAGKPDAADAVRLIGPLLDGISPRDGWLAVLGNHDTHDLVDHLAAAGVQVLVNESIRIDRSGGLPLHFVGTDDVHAFFSDSAPHTITQNWDGFRVALVHTVDLASLASQHGYRLYLAGHSHGGQICLRQDKPLLTALDSHKDLASGRWRLENMQGYTSRGLGHGICRLRLNAPAEVARLELRQQAPPPSA